MKKVFIAASLIAFMGTAAFAQQPATQSKDTQQTHQVAHKHHAKTTDKKASSKKHHHASKAKKADSSSVKTK